MKTVVRASDDTYGDAWPADFSRRSDPHGSDRRQCRGHRRLQQPWSDQRRPHQARRRRPRLVHPLDPLAGHAVDRMGHPGRQALRSTAARVWRRRSWPGAWRSYARFLRTPAQDQDPERGALEGAHHQRRARPRGAVRAVGNRPDSQQQRGLRSRRPASGGRAVRHPRSATLLRRGQGARHRQARGPHGRRHDRRPEAQGDPRLDRSSRRGTAERPRLDRQASAPTANGTATCPRCRRPSIASTTSSK